MNGQIPNPPNIVQLTTPPQTSNQTPKKGLIFEILIVILVLVFVFGALSYFNILKLSELFPNYLGFLPHKSYKQASNEAMKQSNNITIKQLKISCPSVKEFCKVGNGIIKDGKYIGLGYKLASGSAIFAAFDGNLTSTFSTSLIEVNGKPTQEKFKTLYLDSPNLNLRGVYYFRGQVTKTGPVIKGKQIGISNGKVIETYDNNSLIFSLIIGYPKTNTPIILNKENFE